MAGFLFGRLRLVPWVGGGAVLKKCASGARTDIFILQHSEVSAIRSSHRR